MVDGSQSLDDQDRDLLSALSGKRFITVINKSDLPQALNEKELPSGVATVHLSTKDGSGLDRLRSVIFSSFMGDQVSSRDHVALTTVRHRDIIARALVGLDRFSNQIGTGVSGELQAIDLRDTLAAIGEITGETTPDAILDIIFSSFCIGK